MTLTHERPDDLARIDALQSEAFYIGAIGSRRNSATRRERLHEHFEMSYEVLDRLHGPAGLYIGSKTPVEIALSIMAEVVAVKNGVSRTRPASPTTESRASRKLANDLLLASTCLA